MATPEENMIEIKRIAAEHGYSVRKDNRLNDTPYRAMNPTIGRILEQPYQEKTLTYDSRAASNDRMLPVDINHELIEEHKAKKLKKAGVPKKEIYPRAHRFANRRQFDIHYMEGK